MSGFPICKSGELWSSLHTPHTPRLQGRQEGAPDQVWLCLAFFPPLSFYHWFFFLFLRSPCSSTTPQRWWLMLTSHCCQNPNSWGQHVTWEQAGPLGLAGGEAQFQLSTLQHPLITPPHSFRQRPPPLEGSSPFHQPGPRGALELRPARGLRPQPEEREERGDGGPSRCSAGR